MAVFLWMPLIALAQVPPAKLAGVLLERDTDTAAGEFAVRAPDYQVYRFQYDAGTSVERDTFSGGVRWLNPGDKVTVESETVSGSLVPYARAVRVENPQPQPMAANRRVRSAAPAPEIPPETGNLTFAGVVSRLNSQSLVLRTRAGEQTLLIRRDTRYVDNGGTVAAAALRLNMRVFVRAGTNLYEQVEAYQVIWGQIFSPVQK